MRTRELLFALAAGSGAIFAFHHILGADRPHAVPPAALAADREPPPGPAADAAPPGIASAGGTAPSPSKPAQVPPELRWNDPGRWFAREEEVPALLLRLARISSEDAFLRDCHRVWGRPCLLRTGGCGPDPDRTAADLGRALDGPSDPVARQRLIFQWAVAVPSEAAFPRLRDLWHGGDSGDAEDALCALAFRGDPDAGAAFIALAARPSAASVGRLADDPEAFDALLAEGDRDAARAWRCIEALDGASYFDRILAPVGVSAWRTYPWSRGSAPAGTDLALLPAWLRRYPGHPGSDDMAYRLARRALEGGSRDDALRWASRAATLPDQAMSRDAVDLLVSIAELSPPEVATVDPDDTGRNRNLLLYIHLRRAAAVSSFAGATEEARDLATREPDLEISRAFLARWAEPAPKGLDSGAEPLPSVDFLRRIEGDRIEDRPRGNPACTWGAGTYPFAADGAALAGEARAEARLHPGVEAVRLPLRRLAFQFRCWETLAELERRAGDAPSRDVRADLLYKAGAVLYHERDSLYPLYAEWGASDRNGLPDAWVVGTAGKETGDCWRDTLVGSVAWLDSTLPHSRAAKRFERVRDEFPDSPVADQAAFSAGLAHIRASEDRPLRRWENWNPDLNLPQGHRLSGLEAFERCAREFPASPLARNAGAAARWWRRFLYGDGETR